MNFTVVATFLALVLVATSADQGVSEFVVNGEDAFIEDFPYMAKVWNLNWPACGGAILTSRSVLTAAHCLFPRISRPLTVTIVVGSSYRSGEGGTRHPASRIFSHPEYIQESLVYDVAVIRTATRFTFGALVQPIALSTTNIGVGVEGVFAGWGFIGQGILPRRANLLQKMNIRTISNEVCREMYNVTRRGPFVVDQKLCILSGQRTSVCGGDSGSPLVINGMVAGVLSWRTQPCGDGLPDVFIRIPTVQDWIVSVA